MIKQLKQQMLTRGRSARINALISGTRLGGLCHAFGADIHNPEPLLKSHHPRKDERCVLPEREPRSSANRGDEGWILNPEPLDRRETSHEDGRLAEGRVAEFLDWTVKAHLIPQRDLRD